MVPGTPSGTPSTIICARCGWQNEATARMCGGCGAPLRSTDPAATSQANTGPVELYSQDAPTTVSPNPGVGADMIMPQPYAQPATPPAQPQPATPVGGPAPAWPGAGQAAAKSATRQFRWWLIPVIILAIIVVLGIGTLGVYGLGISPSMHNQVQTVFPNALGHAFTQVNSTLTPTNGQVQIPAATLDQLISAQSPTSGSITNLHLRYTNAGFQLTYTFNFFGSETQDTTAFFSVDPGNRLAARGTIVDGSMSLFESGTEMEQILNNALANLTAIQGKVQSFQVANGVLTVHLTNS